MGFKVGRIYVLEFESTGMEGAVVKVRSPSIDTTEKVTELPEEEARALLFEHITEWNLEDEAGAIPVDLKEARARVEPSVLGLIAKEWYRAARGLSAPLDPRTTLRRSSSTGSDDGAPSPEMVSEALSIPMETS